MRYRGAAWRRTNRKNVGGRWGNDPNNVQTLSAVLEKRLDRVGQKTVRSKATELAAVFGKAGHEGWLRSPPSWQQVAWHRTGISDADERRC
jgi:hypothetical protein